MRERIVLRATATAAAAALAAAVAGPPARAADTATPVDGVWTTDGYATVLSIDHGRMTGYETTAVSCLPLFTAGATGPAGPEGRVAFTDDDGDVIRVWRDGPRGHLTIDGSVGVRGLRRTAALPARCTRPTPKDPRATFDVFWRTFAENYPFFAAKGVDWDAVRRRYRPQVTAGTTDDRLAAILDEMIAPLHDAHTMLIADGRRYFHVRPGTTLPTPDYDARIKAFIAQRDTPLRDFAQGRISYADLPGGLGYLRISGFGGYTDEDTYAANAAELDRTLDAVLTPARTSGPTALRGLIIDLRVNGGGSDELGLRIASRLTGRPYTAYAKRVRNDPQNPAGFTRPQPIRVRPAGAPVYRGPVALLTGGSTVSAGETFTQALMDRSPRPVRIGANTQGVFSDILDRKLPNGWAFGLPDEEFLTRTGRTFDGPGIPPDIRTPVLTDEELAEGCDSAFDRAVALLSGRAVR
ncbi:S41 family peptidase [Actinoallomurus rhizosphaericola]|uniref:S41 family peptidase n=1 Tax=Actinoallomurus rhizosphaericola TaxID=2952536 RepID=UPI002093038B|nr:S41 family peptidase [Actinoallomurus rhizosphaericola]MCO5996319.1 S41 family peptidase [Actinoallomurus rhizosphaericola]